MLVDINGEKREFPEGSTLAQVLESAGVARRGVAVAVDGEVVRRGRWAEYVPGTGARIEVLTAVQGG